MYEVNRPIRRVVINSIRCEERTQAGVNACSTLFGIYFPVTLKHVIKTSTDGIYLQIRSDDEHYVVSRLNAETTVGEVLIRDKLSKADKLLR